ncbi:Uncharacterised protein [Klebsiella pneumoniae]|nr:Uncharacterised protein [Klebsiella pneumoniae]
MQSFGFEESTRSRQADQLWELLKVHLLVFGVFTKAHPADFFSNQLQPVAVAGEQVDMIDRWLWRKTTNQHPRQVIGLGVFGDQLVDAKGCHHFQDVRLLDCKAFFHLLHFRIFIAICFVFRVIVATLVAKAVPQDHGACVKNGRIATNVFDEAKHRLNFHFAVM